MKKIISGKVRDVFEVDDAHLAIVTTDRISAFDVILNSEIPGKGVALNSLSNFWFSYTSDIVPNHLVSTSLDDFPAEFQQNPEFYRDRTVLVKKLRMLPYEFIVRGYLFGNMWEAYRQGKAFCGRRLSGTYQQADAGRGFSEIPGATGSTGRSAATRCSFPDFSLAPCAGSCPQSRHGQNGTRHGAYRRRPYPQSV